MSTDNKLPSSGSTPRTNEVIQNVICDDASKQASQIGKDPPSSGSQGRGHSVQPTCSQAFQQNVPAVIITAGQRQSQTCPKTAKRSTLIEVPIDGRHQQGQRSLHSNQEAVNSPVPPVHKKLSMEELCKEKAGAAVFYMAPCGSDPISPPLRTPTLKPPPSGTLSSLPCRPSPPSYVPVGQPNHRKQPPSNLPGYSTTRSQPVPLLPLSNPPPQAPQVFQQPPTPLHDVPQTFSANLRPQASPKVLANNLVVETFPSETPKDLCPRQQKDQGTLGPALSPNIMRSTSGPATSNELKASSIQDGCLPSTNVNTPGKSPGQPLVKQPSGNAKDPHTFQQKDQETGGGGVIPNITRTSLGQTTPSDFKTSNTKDGSTNVSTTERSPGQFVVKQSSESPKDPHKCQKNGQNLMPSVNPDVTRSTLGPTIPIEFKASTVKDGCTSSTKVNPPHEIPEQPLVKQPKVVLKRLKRTHCSQSISRQGSHSSTTKELQNAFWKLRSSIDALTKDEDKKSVHFSQVTSLLYPSISRSTGSKHYLSGDSFSRGLHSSPSKKSAARDSHFQSGKHLFGRSKSFSYSSSWKTPSKVQILPSSSSDPSGKMKANSSSIQVKSSSRQVCGKQAVRALSYEERKTLPLSASKTMPSPSLSTGYNMCNESDQRGVRLTSKPSLQSTVSKQNASSPGQKTLITLENVAETLSDSEANVRKSVSAHFRQNNKPAKPFMVERRSKHSPNPHPQNQRLPQSEGKAKDSPSNSQKNSAGNLASSENQPSFMQLLEIASKNASVKGNLGGNHDWQYSRKRRYSDGQINKCRATDPRHFMRPFHESVSSIKIPKLERLEEHLGETSDSGNMKECQMQKSVVTPGKGKDNMGEVSEMGMGVGGTPTSMSPKGIGQHEENGVSVNKAPELPSSTCNKHSIAGDEGDDETMSCDDTPEGTEDVGMTGEAATSTEGKADARKGLTRANLIEMLGKKERKVEDSASKQDLIESRRTGAGVQGLFSELQKSGEESKRSNSSSPSRSSMTSSPSGSEKRILNITHLKKVKKILTGIVLKKQASVDSDASTKDGSSSSTPSPVPSEDERQQIIPPQGDKDTKEKERGLMKETDIFTTENSDSESSEEDDSFLQLKPSALIEETNALMDAPMPVTPSKMSHSQVPYSPVILQSTRTKYQGTVERPQVGYTLDKILHMKIDQDKKDGDITTIRDKLMDGVSKGGIAKLATEAVVVDEDIDVDPEAMDYPKCLAKFSTKSERIPDIPPGEEIFDKKKICQLFTPTQCLCVKNFLLHRDNQTNMESLLLSATPEEVEEVITSGCLELCESIPDDMMRWMFLLMSIHPSAQENHLLYQTQWMHLSKAPLISDELRFPWIPSLKDILTVLLNYGADLAGLVSVSDFELDFSEEMLRDKFSHGKVDASAERRDVCFKEEEGVFVMILKNHLCQAIKILTQAIFTHMTLKDCSGYRTEELQCLLIIMMRIALDKTVIGLPVAVDITMAIAAILAGFEDSVWYQEVERMCVLFPLITSHHHNMVYLLLSCMPLHVERGRYLCRRLSYAGLQNLVLPEKNTQRLSSSLDQNVSCIKISSLIPILQCCKPSTATDYYQLNSIIQLLDYSIGNEILENYEKRELDQITRKLREMVGDIRESALSLSRSQVKSLILRTATKLSFMTQSMLTNQESIFSFLRSDTPVGMEQDEEGGNPEHHIRSQDDAASLPSDEDDGGDDDAGAMEMEPFSDGEVEGENGRVRVKDDSKEPCDNEGKEEGQRAKEGDKKLDSEEQGVKEGQTEVPISVHSGKSCANKDLEQDLDIPSGLEVMETSGDKGDQIDSEISTSVEVGHTSKEIQRKSEIPKKLDFEEQGVKEGQTEVPVSVHSGKSCANQDLEQHLDIPSGLEVMETSGAKGDQIDSEISTSVEVGHTSKEIQRKSDIQKKLDSEEQGVKEGQTEVPVSVHSGKSCANKDLEQDLDIPCGLEVIETSGAKGDQLDSEISTSVGHTSKEIQLKSDTQTDAEKIKTSEGIKEVQREPEIKPSVEVNKTDGSEDLERESEISVGVDIAKQSGCMEMKPQPGISVDIGENRTLGDKDLGKKSEVSVGVEGIQTSERRNLEQKSEVVGSLEVQETLEWKKSEVEPNVKVDDQARESSRSMELQLKPKVQSCPQAGESLSDEKVQLDSEVHATALSGKALRSKELECKSGVQVPVEAGEVSKDKGKEGESSLGEVETPCTDVANGGNGLMEEVTPRPLADPVIPPEKATEASSQTKKTVWVPVKVEYDLSPVKGSLEEDVKRPVSVSSGVLPTAGGVTVVKIEKEEQVIDLTSPERKEVPTGSTQEVIDLDSDDSDVICLD